MYGDVVSLVQLFWAVPRIVLLACQTLVSVPQDSTGSADRKGFLTTHAHFHRRQKPS